MWECGKGTPPPYGMENNSQDASFFGMPKWYANWSATPTSGTLLDSMVASFVLKFLRDVVLYWIGMIGFCIC